MVSCKSRLKGRAHNRVKVSLLLMAMESWLYWLLVMGEMAMAMIVAKTLVLFSSKGSIKGAL